MPQDAASQVAYCAEFDSDEGEEVQSTRRMATGSLPREQANITVKRMVDAQGPASTSKRPNSQDLASDSGYSSRTQATSASADSGKRAIPLPPPPTTMDAPTAAMTGDSAQDQLPNLRPTLSRTSSKSSRKPRQCTDPNCDKCMRGRMTMRSANTSQKSASKSPNLRPPPDERARSTSTKRLPDLPEQSTAPTEPQPRPRPPLRSNSTSRARPRSMYDNPYVPPMASGGPPVAYFNAHPYVYHTQGYMTGAGNMMVAERPAMPHRATDTAAFSARGRPTSMFGAPLVSYDPTAGQRLSARRPTKPTYPSIGYGAYEDEAIGGSDEYDSPEDAWRQRQNEAALDARRRAQVLQREQDALRMPPPLQPASASGQPKYSMRTYDKTATRITYGDRDQDFNDAVRNTARPLDDDILDAGPSRARRPSQTSSGDRSWGPAASQPVAGSQRVTIQDPRTSRRQSYVGTEGLDELLTKHYRSSLAAPTLRHKRGSPDFTRDVNADPYDALLEPDTRPTRYDKQAQAALAYQRKTDRLMTPEPASLTDKNVRRHAGLPAGNERRESPARSNVSDDGSARISSRRQIRGVPSDRMSVQEGEVRMRVDLRNEVELEFEGRRLAIAPTGEGSIAELVIGSKREGTTYYTTSKDSVSTESRLGRRDSMRGKQPATPRKVEREPPTPTRSRREQPERDDDERSTTTSATNVSRRPTRPKRAETYAASSSRRAAEDSPNDDDLSGATRLRRRTTTEDQRYEPAPPSPASSKNKRSFLGRS